MGLVRFDPVRSFESLAKRMSDFANEIERGFSFEYGGFQPRVDIFEDEKGYYLEAELPGLVKEDVKLTVNEDNVLILKGSKKREVKEEGKSFIRVERNYGEFTRSFVLPDNIKKDSIKAKFENGILNVSLEKTEPEKPKEVEISIA